MEAELVSLHLSSILYPTAFLHKNLVEDLCVSFVNDDDTIDCKYEKLLFACKDAWNEFLDSIGFILHIKERHVKAKNLVKEIECEDGWIAVANEKEIETFYKKEKDILSVKIKAKFTCPLMNLITLINEVDLIPKFLTLIPLQIACRAQISKFSKAIYTRASLYWPLWDRDLAFKVCGLDYLHEGYILIMGEEHTEPNVDDAVRMKINLSGARFTLISEDVTFVEIVLNVNPMMPAPLSFISFVTRHLAYYGILLLRDKCSNLDSEWIERQKNVWIYDDISNRISKYFQKK